MTGYMLTYRCAFSADVAFSLSSFLQKSVQHRDSRPSTPPHDSQDLRGKLESSPDPTRADSPIRAFPPLYHESPGLATPSPPPAVTRDHANSTNSINSSSSPTPAGRQRSSSRPQSMVQTYHPPLMEVNGDTSPELQPIFTFLNSHQNKLYQEGYFLKLDDQDSSACIPLTLVPSPPKLKTRH
jgi:CCR4-NOT transcriptional complex subunit CAF120